MFDSLSCLWLYLIWISVHSKNCPVHCPNRSLSTNQILSLYLTNNKIVCTKRISLSTYVASFCNLLFLMFCLRKKKLYALSFSLILCLRFLFCIADFCLNTMAKIICYFSSSIIIWIFFFSLFYFRCHMVILNLINIEMLFLFTQNMSNFYVLIILWSWSIPSESVQNQKICVFCCSNTVVRDHTTNKQIFVALSRPKNISKKWPLNLKLNAISMHCNNNNYNNIWRIMRIRLMLNVIICYQVALMNVHQLHHMFQNLYR